ncbi:MAG: phosphoribosyltransferase [Bacillota bacterium]
MEVKYVQEQSYRITWAEVETICRDIALSASKGLSPDLVVGVAKGGLIPATIVASMLRVDLYPCIVTRRHRGEIISDVPRMVVSVTDKVAGQRVLVVDEMVLSGDTMRSVTVDCKKKKARVVKTASIWAGTESWKPTWYGIETPGYVMFPWDYEVLAGGKFVLNPVYQEYLDSAEMMKWAK